MLASCWVARKIFLSPAKASSKARTLDSRPTTNGVIMNGKITTSRMGIIGSFLVSNFSRWVTGTTLSVGSAATPRKSRRCTCLIGQIQRAENPDDEARIPRSQGWISRWKAVLRGYLSKNLIGQHGG